MTVREKFEEILINNGMLESQAKETMDIAVLELSNMIPNGQFIFDKPADECPSQLYTAISSALNGRLKMD